MAICNDIKRGTVVMGEIKRLPGERIAQKQDIFAAYKQGLSEYGLDFEKLLVAKQVHGNTVLTATCKDAEPQMTERGMVITPKFECDGLISRNVGLIIGVVTADCLPILLYSHDSSVVAAVHAGWRGLASGIVARAVRKMGVDASGVSAYIGTAICQKCFEVGPEVADEFTSSFGQEISKYIAHGRKDRMHVDLTAIAVHELRSSGVLDVNISQSQDCTCCNPDKYWSHRKHGLQRGNQLTFIALQ